MHANERKILDDFLHQLSQTQAHNKDQEAEQLIRATCARHPDAAYLLVQRALFLDAALADAQTTITRLQTQLDAQSEAPRNGGGFLDNAFGWGRNNNARPAPSMVPAPAPMAQPQAQAGWGGSSFLGSMASTAAGVVAGSLLYQGISSALSHSEHASGAHTGTQSLAQNEQSDTSFWGSSPSESSSGHDLDDLGPDDWS